jgi:hypothetical protein
LNFATNRLSGLKKTKKSFRNGSAWLKLAPHPCPIVRKMGFDMRDGLMMQHRLVELKGEEPRALAAFHNPPYQGSRVFVHTSKER